MAFLLSSEIPPNTHISFTATFSMAEKLAAAESRQDAGPNSPIDAIKHNHLPARAALPLASSRSAGSTLPIYCPAACSLLTRRDDVPDACRYNRLLGARGLTFGISLHLR